MIRLPTAPQRYDYQNEANTRRIIEQWAQMVPTLLAATTRFFQAARPAPAWAASVAVNAGAGNTQFVTATSNIAATVATPTNPPGNGQTQRLVLVFFNNSGGALGTPIAFSAGYATSATVAPANGKRITVAFNYDPSVGLWVEEGRSAAV